MTDLRKAAEMALEALERGTTGLAIRAIPALRQALAQGEQEPVAWMMPDYGDVLSASEADGTGIYNIPLYTAPPNREWVGLTDEEVKSILDCGRGGLVDIKKTEQLLKERNT